MHGTQGEGDDTLMLHGTVRYFWPNVLCRHYRNVRSNHAPFGYLNSDLARRWSGYGVFDRMRKKGQPTTAATSLSAATSAAAAASSCTCA